MTEAILAGLIFHGSTCHSKYKGIDIECSPRYDNGGNYDGYCGKGCNGKKYNISSSEIIAGCRKYIEETGLRRGVCHQMTGGPLTIDGVYSVKE